MQIHQLSGPWRKHSAERCSDLHDPCAASLVAVRAISLFACDGCTLCRRPAHGRSGLNPCTDGHALQALIGVIATCWHRQRNGSCRSYFVEGMGCRAMGCVVWLTDQLPATCLARRRCVRREIAARADLSYALVLRGQREVVVCVPTRKPWGFQFGFLALLAVELSVLVSPLARDCILVRFLRIFRPFQFLSLFRLTSAAMGRQQLH